MGDGIVLDGGSGVNGGFTQNGGVLSGKEPGANESKGGREEGVPTPYNAASEESNGGSISKRLRAFSFFRNPPIELLGGLESRNFDIGACLLASAKQQIISL